MTTPEDKARENIDRQLEECGWILQEFSAMNIMAGLGVAVREYQLTTGEADYGLYIDGRVAGVIEAKKEGANLTGVETQTDKYAKGLRKVDSIDADKNRDLAATKFSVPVVAVTEQLDEPKAVSDKALAVGSMRHQYRRLAPRRSHNLQLRENLLRPEHQVIDEFTRDQGQLHGRTSFEINKEDNEQCPQVWFRCSDRVMRSERHYFTTLNYIQNNPVRHGYVDKWGEWAYLSNHCDLENKGRDWLVELWQEYPVLNYGVQWDVL